MWPIIILTVLALPAAPANAAQGPSPAAILAGTPLWVYPLFGLLVYLGLLSARDRTVAPARVAIVPAIFIIWGLVGFVPRIAAAPMLAVEWLVVAVVFAGLAVATRRDGAIQVDRVHGLVRMRGSWLPLARNLAIFAAKYGLTAASAINPAIAGTLAIWDVGVSAATAGYFAGWLALFALRYREAPSVDLVAVPAGLR